MTSPNKQPAPITAVVLGGGEDALARASGVAAKALVPLAGKPMGAHVLEALRCSQQVGHVVYVGPNGGLDGYYDAHVPAGDSLADSLALGLGAALAHMPDASGRLLALTADVPWLTARAIDTFATQSASVDLVYPVIPAAVSEAQFPAQQRTYVKVRDGRFTGGNMVLLTPAGVPPLLRFMDRLYRGRKNPLALAAIFGMDVVAKLLVGRVSIAELEHRAASILGISVSAFISEDASLGADVDKPEHLNGTDL